MAKINSSDDEVGSDIRYNSSGVEEETLTGVQINKVKILPAEESVRA